MNYSTLPLAYKPNDIWHSYKDTNPSTGHIIHYARLEARDAIGTIFILPGLSEFTEKYAETASFFYQYDYNIVIIDWAYQGRSSRLKRHPHRRHSDSFDKDIDDLHWLISKSAASHPHFLLGHSMGGHLAIRYMLTHPGTIKAASLSAPMMGIAAVDDWHKIAKFIAFITSLFLPEKYIPGGRNWRKEARQSDGNDIFSTDPIRDTIHNIWCEHDPSLQVGSPTFQWLYDALDSIDYVKDTLKAQQCATPLFIGLAEQEQIVVNEAVTNLMTFFTNSTYTLYQNAHHEILMETDEIRDHFLQQTLHLFSK